MIPETKYAQSETINIAYQVLGEGPLDLVVVPGWVSNLDTFWEDPSIVRFFQRLATFSRLILFDKRGTGLSDRVTDTPTLEERMDDVRSVLDAVGSERAALLGYSEGGPMCALFSVTYPERTVSLIMIGSYARRISSEDYPWGISVEELEGFLESIRCDWGGPVGISQRAPSVADDERIRQWWSKYLRMSASPSTAVALTRMNAEIDIRHILPSIRVPALLLHATGDRALNVEGSRYMARQIPDAKFVELDAEDHVPFWECPDKILDHIEEFLTGTHTTRSIDRVVATVLFTDIVDSTRLAAELGDTPWRDLLEAHNATVRHELAVHRGKEVKSTGDGFHAVFDGPARAIRCGCAIREAVSRIGVSVRVGMHTGECEVRSDQIEGVAVHIAARVAVLAEGGEVLVSQTVKDLVAGAGFEFEDRGVHTLKGVPDKWRILAVA